VFPWLAREFLAVRPELAGWFSNLGWHGRNCGDGCGASPKAGVLNNLFDSHEFDVRLDSNNRAHGLREWRIHKGAFRQLSLPPLWVWPFRSWANALSGRHP
jgi:hypothetical protein